MSRYSSDSDSSSRRRKNRKRRSRSSSSSSSCRHRRSRKSKHHSSSYRKSKGYSSRSRRSHSRSNSNSRRSRSISKDKKRRRSHSRSKDKYQSKSHHHISRSHSKGHSSKYHSRSSSNDTHSRQSRSPACSNSSSSSGSKKTAAQNQSNTEEQLREKLLKAIKAAESADHQLKQQGLLPKGIKSRNDLISVIPPVVPQPEVLKAIEKDEFVPKTFTSSKNKIDDEVAEITDENISEDAKTVSDVAVDSIFHASFFCDPKAKLDKWVKKLYQIRQRAIVGDPVENY